MARRRRDDGSGPQALVALAVVGGVAGWWETTRQFVLDRLPLFTALGVALVVLLGLVLRRSFREKRRRDARQRVLDTQVASTDGMSGTDSEKVVARLLERDGFTGVRVPGGAGDLGADVVGTSPTGTRIVIQCKRYAQHRGVSSPDMQKFLGTCFHEHGADEAWFVTTSAFSRPATALGSRRGVRLVDRQALAQWMAADLLTEQQPS